MNTPKNAIITPKLDQCTFTIHLCLKKANSMDHRWLGFIVMIFNKRLTVAVSNVVQLRRTGERLHYLSFQYSICRIQYFIEQLTKIESGLQLHN